MVAPNPDPAHCAVRLRTAVSLLSRRLRAGTQRDGLSVAKLSVLGRLYRAGPMTPTELAAREGVKLQSLTRLLAEIEAEGWLAREAHAADGRQWQLSLTRKGARRLTAAVQAGEASLAQAIEARLTGAQRELLLSACALIDELSQALGDEGEQPAATPAAASR